MEKTITLPEKEIWLLKMILEEASQNRSSMGCNDAYKHEEDMFTNAERKKMAELVELESGNLPNFSYVDYILKRIEEQDEQA